MCRECENIYFPKTKAMDSLLFNCNKNGINPSDLSEISTLIFIAIAYPTLFHVLQASEPMNSIIFLMS